MKTNLSSYSSHGTFQFNTDYKKCFGKNCSSSNFSYGHKKRQLFTTVPEAERCVPLDAGHVECSFDNPVEKCRTKCRNVSLIFPKLGKQKNNLFLKKYFLQNCSCGHVEWSFDDTAENFGWRFYNGVESLSKNSRKKFAQCPNLMRNYDYPQWK